MGEKKYWKGKILSWYDRKDCVIKEKNANWKPNRKGEIIYIEFNMANGKRTIEREKRLRENKGLF